MTATATDTAPDPAHSKKCPACGFWNANRAEECTNEINGERCGTKLKSKGKGKKPGTRALARRTRTATPSNNGAAHDTTTEKAATLVADLMKAGEYDKAGKILEAFKPAS